MFDTHTELTHHYLQAHGSIAFVSCRYCGQKYVRGMSSEHLKQCKQDPIQRVKKFCQNCNQEVLCYRSYDLSKHQQKCLMQNGNEHEAVTIRTGLNLGEAVRTGSVSGELGHTGSISRDLVDTGLVLGELVNIGSYSEGLVNDSDSNLIETAEPVQTGSNSSNTSIEPGKILVHTDVYSTNQGKPEKVPQTVSNLTETTIESGEILVQTGLNTTRRLRTRKRRHETGDEIMKQLSERDGETFETPQSFQKLKRGRKEEDSELHRNIIGFETQPNQTDGSNWTETGGNLVQTGSNLTTTTTTSGAKSVQTGSTSLESEAKLVQTGSTLTETVKSGTTMVQTGSDSNETAELEGNPCYTGSTLVPSGSETQMKHKCHFCPKIFKNAAFPVYTFVESLQRVQNVAEFGANNFTESNFEP
ncbi:hypothetical protein Pmani_011905 [Petrolisthes manimaculis]|uniref:Uncharacterized protein n=1 Tax=Petrolisthes manimaculis TaxID=1843537 RepID=A0AAE1PYT0_9EUCA|nr:hypothetical protein Pmani_011905 [Petrolisthes manimaculis]